MTDLKKRFAGYMGVARREWNKGNKQTAYKWWGKAGSIKKKIKEAEKRWVRSERKIKRGKEVTWKWEVQEWVADLDPEYIYDECEEVMGRIRWGDDGKLVNWHGAYFVFTTTIYDEKDLDSEVQGTFSTRAAPAFVRETRDGLLDHLGVSIDLIFSADASSPFHYLEHISFVVSE